MHKLLVLCPYTQAGCLIGVLIAFGSCLLLEKHSLSTTYKAHEPPAPMVVTECQHIVALDNCNISTIGNADAPSLAHMTDTNGPLCFSD